MATPQPFHSPRSWCFSLLHFIPSPVALTDFKRYVFIVCPEQSLPCRYIHFAMASRVLHAPRDTIHAYPTEQKSSKRCRPCPPPSPFTRGAKQWFPQAHVERVWTSTDGTTSTASTIRHLLCVVPHAVNVKKKKVWRRETQSQVWVFQFSDLDMYRGCEFGKYTAGKGGGRGIQGGHT